MREGGRAPHKLHTAITMVTHPTECLQKVLEQSDSKGSLSPLPAELCLLQMMGIGERGVQGS